MTKTISKYFPITKLLVGMLIFSAYFLILLFTGKDTGIFWDEPAYYQSSINYLEWFKKPSLKTIDNYWLKYSPTLFELHPPLEKIVQAGSYALFHNRLKIMSQIDSFKFPNIVFASLLVFSVYLFCLKYLGFLTALSSSLFLTVIPRFFGHAHFAAMDIPLTFFVFLTFCFLWKYKDKNLIIPGIFLGLALSTKATGLLFLFPFCLFLSLRSIALKKNLFQLAKNLIFMIFTIFIIFITSWPKIWVDPIKRLIEFFGFFSENKVPFYYFGQTYLKPPWHFPAVMLGITTPILILLLSILGILSALLCREKQSLKLFILLNFLFLPILLSLPSVAAYDAERLLLPSFPFMAILGGLGASFLIKIITKIFSRKYYAAKDTKFSQKTLSRRRIPWEWIKAISPANVFQKIFSIQAAKTDECLPRVESRGFQEKFSIQGTSQKYFSENYRSRALICIAIIGLAFFSSLSMLIHYYPFELSSYNLLIGGLKGAEKIGMEPQYTLESLKATVPFINNTCPKNCSLTVFQNYAPYLWYQRDNLLRSDIRLSSFDYGSGENSNYVVLPIRKSFFSPEMWKLYLEIKPIYSYKIDGVSLVNIYDRKSIQ